MDLHVELYEACAGGDVTTFENALTRHYVETEKTVRDGFSLLQADQADATDSFQSSDHWIYSLGRRRIRKLARVPTRRTMMALITEVCWRMNRCRVRCSVRRLIAPASWSRRTAYAIRWLSGSRRGDRREAASRGTSRHGCSADFLLVFGGVCGLKRDDRNAPGKARHRSFPEADDELSRGQFLKVECGGRDAPALPDRPPKLSYSAAAAARATATWTSVSENVGALPRSA